MTMANRVEWRPILGYEGLYEAGSDGTIRSVDRVVPHGGGRGYRRLRGKTLKGRPNDSGHLLLFLSRDGVLRPFLAHRLVAQTFIPNPEDHPMVLHWDDNPSNNAVENLRWGTAEENWADSKRNGWGDKFRPTECPHGHAYTAENVYHDSRGARRCVTCRNTYERERRRAIRNGRAKA